MIKYISDWANIIIAVIILAALAELLSPSDNYRKYVRFAIGLILTAVIMRPIVQLRGQDFALDMSLPQVSDSALMHKINEQVQRVFEDKVRRIVLSYGFEDAKVETSIDGQGDIHITRIYVKGQDADTVQRLAADLELSIDVIYPESGD